jgi:hypothetical protein
MDNAERLRTIYLKFAYPVAGEEGSQNRRTVRFERADFLSF